MLPKRRGAAGLCRVLAVVRWPVGGIRTHLLYTYPRLFDAGYRFDFVGPEDESFRAFVREVAAWPDTECFAAPVINDECQFRPLVRELLSTRHYGLVHSHGLMAAAQVATSLWWWRVPHVVTSQDVFRADQFATWRQHAKRWGIDFLLSRTNALVAVSEDVRQNHLEWLPLTAHGRCRVVNIPNGIELSKFDETPLPAEGGIRAELGLGSRTPLWGFLGRFMEQKGFVTLVDAVSRLAERGAEFHLLAVGSGDFEREYRDLVAQRGLAHRITFRGFVPHVNQTLRQLDLLVMPSLWEACPLLPMEAMIAGVPVLGTDCLGLREVLAQTPAVVVPTGDAVALAAALDRSLCEPWTAAAREFAPRARERFRIDHCATSLARLFDSLTGRSGAECLSRDPAAHLDDVAEVTSARDDSARSLRHSEFADPAHSG